jgi:hypothetical protein
MHAYVYVFVYACIYIYVYVCIYMYIIVDNRVQIKLFYFLIIEKASGDFATMKQQKPKKGFYNKERYEKNKDEILKNRRAYAT